MLKECFYPFIDFILPCQDTEVKQVCQLQYATAITLTSSRDLLQHFISEVPPQLFPYLFKAVVHHTFTNSKSGRVAWFSDSIILLIHHWPFEKFVLRELLTSGFLPFTIHRSNSLQSNKEIFQSFVDKLVTVLIKAFIYERNGVSRKLRKFDISGVGVNVEEIFTLSIFKEKIENLTVSKLDTSEFICEVYFVMLDQYASYLSDVLPSAGNSNNAPKVSAVFDKIYIASLPVKNILNIMNYIKKWLRVRYLELSLCSIDQQFIDNLSRSSFSKPLEGLGLSYCVYSNLHIKFSFNFLKNFRSLHQLDLSGSTSKSGWSILGELPNGLTFLKMVGCGLNRDDFLSLTKHSKHSKTLVQLDLSENNLSEESRFVSFADFIGNLQNIQILEVENCKLGKVSNLLLDYLLNKLLTGCTKLTLLQMMKNDFSSRFLMENFIVIVQMCNLRLICLTMPSDVYIRDEYRLIDMAMTQIKSAFQSAIQNQDSSCLRIAWKEETKYSHWFYAVS